MIASDALGPRSPDGGGDAPSAMAVRMPQKLVSPGYFDVYEIGLVSGRRFTEAEASGAAAVSRRVLAPLPWSALRPKPTRRGRAIAPR